jgi:hypothetical protein
MLLRAHEHTGNRSVKRRRLTVEISELARTFRCPFPDRRCLQSVLCVDEEGIREQILRLWFVIHGTAKDLREDVGLSTLKTPGRPTIIFLTLVPNDAVLTHNH